MTNNPLIGPMGKILTWEQIPIITLWQPWASFVALGWKTIETRWHKRFEKLTGKVIGIHASVKWDANWLELAGPYLSGEQRNQAFGLHIVRGIILCTAVVHGFRALGEVDSVKALINCGTTDNPGGNSGSSRVRYGLELSHVISVDPPIQTTGRQGIWYHKPQVGKESI